MKKLFASLYLAGWMVACTTNPPVPVISLSEKNTVVLLDSIQASTAILKDQEEMFFEKVTITDMCLQMKRADCEGMKREQILSDYKNFLRADVDYFSEEEFYFIRKCIKKAYKLTQKVSKDIFPEQIELIKTKGKHYGPSVYYTRENRIIIPANELQFQIPEEFTSILLHELFHIYSRYNPEKKEQLYSLIGFHLLPCEPKLPEQLKAVSLLNPDGVSKKFAINLRKETETFPCIPLLQAVPDTYTSDTPDFFRYLNFQLYPVRVDREGTCEVVVTESIDSPVELEDHPEFYEQIKDNTTYIIHPDEIMADNFKVLILSKTNKIPFEIERFSVEGQKLLLAVEHVLTSD